MDSCNLNAQSRIHLFYDLCKFNMRSRLKINKIEIVYNPMKKIT